MERPNTLAELIAALAALPDLDPAERARRCPALIEVAKGVLHTVRGEAVREAVDDGARQVDLARELGISKQKLGDIYHGRR